jgi:transcriptional coactivator HFI1/ADA1
VCPGVRDTFANFAHIKTKSEKELQAKNKLCERDWKGRQEMAEISTRTPTQTPIVAQNQIKQPSKRIEVELLAMELRQKLGTHWDKYQATISAFLIGKLSRNELTSTLSSMLTDSKLIRMHNQLLLANMVNALRDGPGGEQQSKYSFGASSKKTVKKGMKQSSQYEKLKKDIMNLPIRERYRIKTITRDSGKQKMANSSLTLTRQALLPKIPFSSDKEKMLGNVIEWTQDISHALNTPLSIESYALPEQDHLKLRMLGIAREHGVIGALGNAAAEMLYHGLEVYLKGILEAAIDTVRYRKRKYNNNDSEEDLSIKKSKITLTNEDMVDTFDINSFLMEPSGPLYRLHSVSLQDDCYVEPKCAIDDILPQQTSKISSPVVQKSDQDDQGNKGDRNELDLLIRDILMTQ